MRFIVTGSAIDGLPIPAQDAVAAYRATFELLASGADPRIAAVYPHADQRVTTLVVDAPTAEDLRDCLMGLPAFFLSTWESHPVTGVDSLVEGLSAARG